MTRRTDRRRFAILGVLAEYGPTTGLDLCLLLHRGPGTIYPDLAVLEGDGRIVGEWEPGVRDRPRRRLYRLPTDDERRAHRRRQLAPLQDAPVKPPPTRWAPKPAYGT